MLANALGQRFDHPRRVPIGAGAERVLSFNLEEARGLVDRY